ncbi:3-oxoacyl-[acyl-carrier-protein] reductase [Ligilactobacillus equi]|uniref:3-oxoacyl-[acyl-carrier-protein] reductase n=1 Tax=Ligilactobacillus equi DPC 6820 TaxID=1392007 RepID=V7HVH2_9LACO|nr:3-oxoacyl-[acyl-carrier-protein] reductase [Ligilactobacillus equi]ETA73223.1 3-oxoacyl-[acyl-carrier-protein] reductase [Ligilactobacillus equi DPC 6820]
MDLQGKNVFVSGSSRGIGLAIAKKFAQAGANIVLNARKEIPAEVLVEIESYGGKVFVSLGDISSVDDVKRMLKESWKEFDGIDVLINNAGITNDKLLIGMKPADFESVINVNLNGTFMMTQAFLKKMYKQKSGVIINMASVIGLHGNIGQANYAAAKAGVIGLTKSVAKEGALRGIRCNAIAPGMIVSDMTDVLSDKVKEDILAGIPLQRFGKVDEVASAALFLAQNDYVTGQVLTVDGGMTI